MPKAKNLKYFRKSNNLTQEQFAELIGVSRSTIIAWEKRKRAIPMPSATRIAEKFNVDYDDFCDVDIENLTSDGMQPTQHELRQLMRFRRLSDSSKTIFRAALDAAYQAEHDLMHGGDA